MLVGECPEDNGLMLVVESNRQDGDSDRERKRNCKMKSYKFLYGKGALVAYRQRLFSSAFS